ncbi:MAG: hypothetical protein MUP66_03485 [Candidatus Nanohaloarchaeota archaeon QJJ-5]|nr:hypothetical protein [Candidatus Nanohaloarchaeota archaeon QJJ-5]
MDQDVQIERYIEDLEKITPETVPETDGETYPGSIDFSTDRANYHFIPGHHKYETSVSADLLDDIDAYVVETGSAPIGRVDLEDIRAHDQYTNTINTLIENETPIYMVDMACEDERIDDNFDHAIYHNVVKGTEMMARVVPAFVGLSLGTPAGLVGTVPLMSSIAGLYGGKIDDRLDTAISYSQVSNFYTPSAGRSAKGAEKIEDFVAPNVFADQQHKPEIAIEYGSAHCDMRPYLEHETLRSMVTSLHDQIGYRPVGDTQKGIIGEIQFIEEDQDGSNQIKTDEGTHQFIRYRYDIEPFK